MIEYVTNIQLFEVNTANHLIEKLLSPKHFDLLKIFINRKRKYKCFQEKRFIGSLLVQSHQWKHKNNVLD